MNLLSKLESLRKKSSSDLGKVFVNLFWLSGDKVLQMGLGLVVGAWVARYLGPDQFGALNYAMAFAGLFSPVIKLGLDQIVIRDLVRDVSKKDLTIGTALVMQATSGLIAFLLATGMAIWLNPTDPLMPYLVALMAGTSFLSVFQIFELWFQSQVHSKYAVWSKNSAYLLITGVKVVLIQMGASVVAFATALLIESGLAALNLAIAYQLTGNVLRKLSFSATRAKELFAESWPLILSSFVIMVYMRMDQVMLGQMSTVQEVGTYAAAVKIAELWYFVPAALVQSMFPLIIQAKDIDERSYYRKLGKLLLILAVASYGFAGFVSLFPNQLVSLIYGEDYLAAVVPLVILAWTGLFVSLGLARSAWMVTENMSQLSFLTTAMGAIANLILNYLLIPTYGSSGAAIATLVAQAVATFFSNLAYARTRRFFTLQLKAILILPKVLDW